MSATITKTLSVNKAIQFIEDNFATDSFTPNTYFYTGKCTQWDDEYSPDIASYSPQENIKALRDRIYMKKLYLEDAILCIKRFNWETGVTYTRADHDVEYTKSSNWSTQESPFYVINSELNVYKCISNNYDSESTVEPTGQSLEDINLGDGYIWKFMYALDQDIRDKFVSDTWFPVPYDDRKAFIQTQVEDATIPGTIDYIHVKNGGTGFTSTPTLRVKGDGYGAKAVAVVTNESISSIQISEKGSSYTFAEVEIVGNGSGAELTPMISPVLGHGSDASQELGAFFIEMSTKLIGDEDGFLPTTGTYRNVGIVQNTRHINTNIITDEKINTISDLSVTDASGTFQENEKIIGEDTLSEALIYYDDSLASSKVMEIYKINGTFANERVYGQESGEVATIDLSTSTLTSVNITSGDLLYKENLIFIARREIQTEKFIFTIEF